MWRSVSSAIVLVWLLSAAAAPAEGPVGTAAGGPVRNGRTDITAKRITMRNQENKVIFEGNVLLKKGALVVHSDVMVVFLKPDDPQAVAAAPKAPQKGSDEVPTVSNRSVSIIEATGQVKIEKAEGRATCRKAVYNEDERKIILTGNPVAWQHGTCVSGKKIVMFLDDDRTIVEGGSRVMIEPQAGGQAPAVCGK